MLNTYLIRPVIGVMEGDTYHLIPALRFSKLQTKVDDKTLKTFAIVLTFINLSLGLSWTNRLKVKTPSEDEMKFQKYSLKQNWLMGYTFLFLLFGIVTGFAIKSPQGEVIALFSYGWAFLMMVIYSTNRNDYIIDEMYSDARGMNESLIEYLMEMTNERVIAQRTIKDLENELKEAKKKPVRKAAPKKTKSAE